MKFNFLTGGVKHWFGQALAIDPFSVFALRFSVRAVASKGTEM